MPDPASAVAGGGGGGGNPNSKDKASPTTAKAAAEDFVHLYVDEPRWLRIFLTYVLREGGRAGPTVADTLLELLLREWAAAGGGLAVKKQREDEVMALLDNPRAGYDADHALVLVQMLNFKPGQLYLYEKVRALSVVKVVVVVVIGCSSVLSCSCGRGDTGWKHCLVTVAFVVVCHDVVVSVRCFACLRTLTAVHTGSGTVLRFDGSLTARLCI